MNGRDLALGLMAGLALAGAVRKRGSANTERKILVLDPSLLTVVREQVQEQRHLQVLLLSVQLLDSSS